MIVHEKHIFLENKEIMIEAFCNEFSNINLKVEPNVKVGVQFPQMERHVKYHRDTRHRAYSKKLACCVTV